MTIGKRAQVLRKATASALLAALLLAGCGGESPEALMNSAKESLQKHDHKTAVIQLKNVLQKDPQSGEARFLLAKALLDGGDPAGAEVELRKAQDLKYPDDQVIPLLARTLLTMGQGDKVINDLAKAELTTAEAKADLQTTIGQAYLLQGKPDLAEAAYAASLSAQPGYSPALIGEARLKASKGDMPGAVALLDRGIEASPGLYDAWQLKGDLLAAQQDQTGALAAYRKSLEIKPDYLAAHAAIVRQLLSEGKLDEASQQLEQMKKVSANHPQTLYLRAALAYQQKDYAAARDAIQLTLRVAPENPLALQLAGLIEYQLQSFPQAETYLLKALPQTPPLGMARRALIASYLRDGRAAKALGILEPILDKIEKDPNLLALAGQVYLQNGQVDKAGSYFAKASALDPKDPTKRTSLAMISLAKGDSEVAFRDLEQVAAGDTGTRADMTLITAHLQRREFDQALKAIAALEKKQPDNPLTHNLRGTALIGKKDLAGARKSFEKALSLNPAYFPAAANLANLDLADKKPEEAKKRFESVLAKDPKNVQALVALADLRVKQNAGSEEIVALLTRAVTADPTASAPRLRLIAWYLAKKDNKAALSAAQDALAALPDRPEILDAAGRVQQVAEDYNQALATYGKLATLRPDSVLPYLRMAEIEVAAKNKDAALKDLQKALQIKADSLEAQRGLIMLHLDAGRTKEAIAVAREVQRQRPKEAVGYLFEGDAHASQKAWSDAATAYRNGLKESGSSELATKLHWALFTGGNGSEADKFAETWLKEHPKDVRFRLYLAELAGSHKDYASAAKHYRVLLEAQPDNPMMLNNLAWVSGQMKDPKAIEYAEKANKLAPNQPAVMDTLAGLLAEKGDTSRALDLFRKALELAPDASVIRLNYARALIKAGQKAEAKAQLDQLAKLGDKFAAQAEVAQLLKGL
ncbi:XrtA/PEP-CTERM system TPR-repeat protein PrsT [Accumulibacter sp.]|uniref:XrtA/PEP-CTERM system TPR-repeat protein PrsT n=1 Tax=Accumulibacter sp. TaxID=2053492 RepID=UPI0025CD9339|nr:XrtA/PEP-CTERM system TPR-repeat protein PrsT [Accumulibacter sp.]MCM8596595.1 PEP-CTERM system TPR-repeat protein PrsT [Accumulibacter sp.]MCM8627513.1 PEP-CTERM system TPR-repeat protein PrsT [Accumulibacter sp.]MDS4050743.1 PEP-CTERM system TPR-repeat protein PrsT [Accumulibacter sp.]